jgi:hypothetical protein
LREWSAARVPELFGCSAVVKAVRDLQSWRDQLSVTSIQLDFVCSSNLVVICQFIKLDLLLSSAYLRTLATILIDHRTFERHSYALPVENISAMSTVGYCNVARLVNSIALRATVSKFPAVFASLQCFFADYLKTSRLP